MKSDEERRQEANAWNRWKPGSGRKGSSPFNKPLRTTNSLNRSLFERPDGTIDWQAFAQAIREERGDGS